MGGRALNNYSRVEEDIAEKVFSSMGLTRSGHTLLWGFSHGHLRWTPHWFRQTIITIWNWSACRVYGHDLTNLEIRQWAEENSEEWSEPELVDGVWKGFPLPDPKCNACGKSLDS